MVPMFASSLFKRLMRWVSRSQTINKNGGRSGESLSGHLLYMAKVPIAAIKQVAAKSISVRGLLTYFLRN